MRACDAAELPVAHDQQRKHAGDHDRPHHRIDVHDSFEPAENDIDRDHERENRQRPAVVDHHDLLKEPRAADQHHARIERHEQKDDRGEKHLQIIRLEAVAHEFRESVRIEREADPARARPEEDESDHDADRDVHEYEPHEPHAELPRDAAEADQRRRADESRAVTHRHDERIDRTPGQQIVLVRSGPAETAVAETADDAEIHGDKGAEHPGIHAAAGVGGGQQQRRRHCRPSAFMRRRARLRRRQRICASSFLGSEPRFQFTVP